jgi:hypothetical protein
MISYQTDGYNSSYQDKQALFTPYYSTKYYLPQIKKEAGFIV